MVSSPITGLRPPSRVPPSPVHLDDQVLLRVEEVDSPQATTQCYRNLSLGKRVQRHSKQVEHTALEFTLRQCLFAPAYGQELT